MTDDAERSVVRSEEHLEVTTRVVPARRVRLRKIVETELETITVRVRRERIVLETYELTASERRAEVDGEPFADADGRALVELIRHEERVVVSTVVVPVERVTLSKEVLVSEETLTGHVRVETVEVDVRGTGRPG